MSTAPMDDYLAPGESVLATIEGIGAALFVTTTTRVVVTLATGAATIRSSAGTPTPICATSP